MQGSHKDGSQVIYLSTYLWEALGGKIQTKGFFFHCSVSHSPTASLYRSAPFKHVLNFLPFYWFALKKVFPSRLLIPKSPKQLCKR